MTGAEWTVVAGARQQMGDLYIQPPAVGIVLMMMLCKDGTMATRTAGVCEACHLSPAVVAAFMFRAAGFDCDWMSTISICQSCRSSAQ